MREDKGRLSARLSELHFLLASARPTAAVFAAMMLAACVTPHPSEPDGSRQSAPAILHNAMPESIGRFHRLAEAGEPRAQYLLAMAYEYGRGVEQDIPAALAWYAKSAERGYCAAELVLARKHFYGDDVAKEHTQAYSRFESLAKKGHELAMSMVAVMQANNWGVTAAAGQAQYWEDRLEELSKGRPDRYEAINWFDPEALCAARTAAPRFATVPTLHEQFRLKGHLDPVIALAFSRDDKRLYSAGEEDEAIIVWDLERRIKQSEVIVPGDPLAIHANGERVLVRVLGKRIAAGRITTGRFEKQNVPGARVPELLSWPLSLIEKVEAGGGTYYRDTRTGQRLASIPPGPGGSPTGIALSPDLSWIVYSTPDSSGRLHVWNVAAAREERRIAAHYPVWIMSVAYSPDGRYVAASGNNLSQVGGATTLRNIRLWDVAAGQEVRGFFAADGGMLIAENLIFSPDGARLAAVGVDFKALCIYVFDVASGRELARIAAGTDDVMQFREMAFSSDGKWLAAARGTDIYLYSLAQR